MNEKPTALNQTNDIQAAHSTAASEPTQQGQYSPNQTQPAERNGVDVKVLKASDFIPSLDGKPWTAPVYAPYNTNIQTMPYPVGCVKNGIYNPYYNSSVAQANATPTNIHKDYYDDFTTRFQCAGIGYC